MLDGLGMAETTPGPLIMVLQFVGFTGAYRLAGVLNLAVCFSLHTLFAEVLRGSPLRPAPPGARLGHPQSGSPGDRGLRLHRPVPLEARHAEALATSAAAGVVWVLATLP
jgi:hypothetical protein